MNNYGYEESSWSGLVGPPGGGGWFANVRTQASGQLISPMTVGIRSRRRSSARIQEEVEENLRESHEFEDQNIRVEVIGGEVFLFGQVKDFYSKRLAERITSETPGVREVFNRLGVTQRKIKPMDKIA